MGAASTSSGPAAPRCLLDGVADARLPADDRGLLYGDGVFRTVRVDAGGCRLWPFQRLTLERDALRIGLPLPAALLASVEADIVRLVGSDSGVLRITVTRGSGPRGYRPPDAPLPRVLLTFTPGDNPPLGASTATATAATSGVTLRLARTRLGISPELAGIKHLGRLEQVRAAMECEAADAFDLLMRDPDDRIVCGTRCNLFIVRGGCLLTPRLDRCGVDGVIRGRVLALAGTALPKAEIVVLTEHALRSADEMFVTNAVFGLRSVSMLHDANGVPVRQWSAPGPVTVQVHEQLCRLMES